MSTKVKTRYYQGVWIDFLHYGKNKGSIALNTSEVNKDGKIILLHRKIVHASVWNNLNEQIIVEMTLPKEAPNEKFVFVPFAGCS